MIHKEGTQFIPNFDSTQTEGKDVVTSNDSPHQINIQCSLCEFILEDNVFKVCEHPLISVPLCMLCLEDIQIRLRDDEIIVDDRCSWCFRDDADEVLICGDGTNCCHNFCYSCISRNLGVEYVTELKSSETDWTCFVCEPEPLQPLKMSLEIAVTSTSMFSETFEFSVNDKNLESIMKDGLIDRSKDTESHSIYNSNISIAGNHSITDTDQNFRENELVANTLEEDNQLFRDAERLFYTVYEIQKTIYLLENECIENVRNESRQEMIEKYGDGYDIR